MPFERQAGLRTRQRTLNLSMFALTIVCLVFCKTGQLVSHRLIVLALTVVVMTPVKVEYWLTEDRERCCTLTLNVFAVSPSVAFKAAAKAASDSDLFDSVFPEFGSRS
jgi:hypothetical protein